MTPGGLAAARGAVSPVAFLDMGISELVVVAVVALLLFGGRLPEVMRTMGVAYRNLRRSWEDLSRQAFDPMRSVARDVYQPTTAPYVGPAAATPAAPDPNAAGASSAVTVAAPLSTPAASSAEPAVGLSGATGAPSAPGAPPAAASVRSVFDDDLPLV